MQAAINPEYAGYIKNYYGNREELERLFPNGEILYLNERTAIVYLSLAQNGEPSISRFGYRAIPHLFAPMDENAAASAGVLQLRQLPVLQLTGQGTLVAVIDSGIDFRLSVFRDAFGRSRVLRLWDMTDQSGNAPELFGFGSEYASEELNRILFAPQNEATTERMPSVDAENLANGTIPGMDITGHGTRMAAIAAGSSLPEEAFTGMAPEAGIIAVKLKEAKSYLKSYYGVAEDRVCYGEDDLMIAVRYVTALAEEFGLPVSIIIGCGSGLGSHAGTGALAQYLGQVGSSLGAVVSVAGGNEGNQGHHYSGEISRTEYEDVQLRVGERESGFTLELWGTVPNNYSIAIQSPSGEQIPVVTRRRNAAIPITFVFEETEIYVDAVLAEEESGLPLIQLRFRAPASGIWSIRVYGQGNHDRITYQMWLPAGGLIGEDTYFLEPSSEITITEPGNAGSVITAVAYDDAAGSLYLENGRGFTADGRPVPTIAAPGVDLYLPSANGFGEYSGTSLAAALTGGCAALLLQWGIGLGREPLITGITIRNYLIRGARRTRNITYPDPAWGYGELDLYETFLSLREDGLPI